jgi:integrase
MALRMAQPWQNPKSGTYYLRQRAPLDLVERTRGTKTHIEIDDQVVVVTIGAVVQVSLRTREPVVAKCRHAMVDAQLRRHWDAVRKGVVRLTHRDAVSLAGWVYRAGVGVFENEPDLSRKLLAVEASNRELRREAERLGADPGDVERELAASALEIGIDIRALAADREISTPAAVEDRFGPLANKLLSQKGLVVDGESRVMLLEEIRRAYLLVADRIKKGFDGDYSPDEVRKRFPPWSSRVNKTSADNGVTMQVLIERWKQKQRTSRSPATLDRYDPSLRSFAKHVGLKDITAITADDIFRWAEERRDRDGVSSKTVNKNDIVAVSSVLEWATKHQGGKVLGANPARGIALDVPTAGPRRERTFRPDEISRILRAADHAEVRHGDKKLLAAKRWCPWLAAYTGARISELTSMHREHVRQEGAVWLVELLRTKGDKPRRVPLHEHLVELGFLQFVQASGPGPLFHHPAAQGMKTHPADLQAEYLARWVRKAAVLNDLGVSPNHGWRHTFKTRLLAANVPERISDFITGHSSGKVGRSYETPTIEMMAGAIAKIPRYLI